MWIDRLKKGVLLCFGAPVNGTEFLSSVERAPTKNRTTVITGFNTDIEHDGTVYHVQTEDKGLDSPLILSLVYVGGAILASKRSPYDDLITKGFDERELADRLNRQHKLICAAIRAGRIEDLKRMNQREGSAAATAQTAPGAGAAKPVKPSPVEDEPLEIPPLQTRAEALQQDVVAAPAKAATPAPELKVKKATPAQKAVKQNVRAILQDVVADFARAEAASEAGLHLSLVDEKEFRGGAAVMLKIRVGRGSSGKEAIDGADVTVKVLGSTFRPLIFPTRTGPDGIAMVRTVLPRFKTGRAAILVRAIADGYEAELRRIIHQG
jgi:hypothetical protein